ncbi:MAG: polyphosphate kinase [Betaproteobacteria bacterium]|nr:MAG: polyphosphate kinase [Betaproteobacteria bacterium]
MGSDAVARAPAGGAAGAALRVPAALVRHDTLIDRELSLLDFNRRVLALAVRPDVPVLERLRYLAIVAGNLDEFFEIRVAGLRGALRSNVPPPGMSLHEARVQYARVGEAAHALVAEQYHVLNASVLPALRERGIRLKRNEDRTPAERAFVDAYFEREVRPLLTPIGLDPAQPFPPIASKTLNFVVELSGRDAFGRDTSIAIVKAPRVLPRVIRLPAEVAGDGTTFVLLSSAIHAHLADLFPGREIVGYSQFRVTRDADLWIDEEEVKNLRQALAGELRARQFGAPLRLEVAAGCPEHLVHLLATQFELTAQEVYRCDGPVNLRRLASLIDQVDGDEHKWPPFVPGRPARLAGAPDILAAIRQHDVLLHHPYESFDPVVDFIRQAADDPDVVAVKQTVYRIGESSALMEALIAAARRGKEVTVVVELLARFDEEANINWSERLEREGAQVVYGVFGLKTHAKLALLLRRERDAGGGTRLVPYAHLGTGNYHPRTTRLYSDFGLLTADPEICADVNEVFLHVTSLARPSRLKRLLLAPFTMHRRIVEMIRREARHAREGRAARIVAKMNGLVEEQVIRALYAASEAGVSIDLVVRGACALRPGVPGMSANIRVRSILGRFLEHHRVWMFENGGQRDVWLASADWMGRNLFRRIEVAFPVRDPQLGERVVDEGLRIYLEDDCDAWTLHADGSWTRATPAPGARRHSAQMQLLERLREHAGDG